MTIKDYINKTLKDILPRLSYKDNTEIEFILTLNEKGEIDDNGLNTIKFTIIYK